MTNQEIKKLETIIGKLENLQNTTDDKVARGHLQKAKSELLRLLSKCP